MLDDENALPNTAMTIWCDANERREDLELLRGAVDIHVHNGPDTYARIQDSLDLARTARSAGMHGICIKTHNFSTGPVAIITRRVVPDIAIYGSIALNHHVGGLNPIAVETALKYEVRQVFMPTVDSSNHKVLTGFAGQHGVGLMVKGGMSRYAAEKPGLELLDEDGKLKPEVPVILEMVAAADVILNCGHVSFLEMLALIRQAKQQKIGRLVVDHPYFSKLDLDQQRQLADEGAFINYTAGELLPRWWRVSIADFAKGIRALGTERVVLSTDCGQIHNPVAPEALRLVCQLLLEEGFTAAEITRILHDNPKSLLYP